MRAEKRPITDSDDEERKRAEKRRTPDAASVLMQALLVDLLDNLAPCLRKIVQEELEKVFKNLGLLLPGRLPEKQFQESDGRKLQLHFMTCLPENIFTRRRLKGKQGDDIKIMLMDANTGIIVSSEPESSLHLEIVVVDGDFNDLPDADWTHEQFERHIVKKREGKGPLVLGQLKVDLANGVAVLGDIKFMDNSRWTRSQKFRLGVRTVAGQSFGSRVREAKSDAFSVKENRGEHYEKHDRPNSNDKVWRLKGIAKNGHYHKALTRELIFTVEDFVRQLVMNPEQLRNIFGSNLRKWDGLVEHARRCIPSKKIYAYYDDAAKKTLVLNNVYEVIGLLENDNYISTKSLIGPEKEYLDYMKRKAYGDRINFKDLDEEALFCHVRRGRRTIGPNSVTLETCLPFGQHVEEFSIPSILMEHTKGIPALMLQHEARQDTELERSSAAASSSDPSASIAPTDPTLFSEFASCSSFTGKTQVGIIGSRLHIHGFGQHDFQRVQPPTLEPCLPAVHNAGQHVEEFSNPSIAQEHSKAIPVSMPEQQLVKDTQTGQSSVLASSHPTASSPNDAPRLDDFAWDELSCILDDNLPDNSFFLYGTLQEADAGFGYWPPSNQHPQKAVTSWLKLRLALRAVISMRKSASKNRTRLMEQGWRTASHGNCSVSAV